MAVRTTNQSVKDNDTQKIMENKKQNYDCERQERINKFIVFSGERPPTMALSTNFIIIDLMS